MSKEPTNIHAGRGGEFKVERNERPKYFQDNRPSLVDVSQLGLVIESVLRAGAYISFGVTTDGGALLVRVLDGMDKLSSYSHTREELNGALEALALRYQDTYPNG